jgi:hypothetical protein
MTRLPAQNLHSRQEGEHTYRVMLRVIIEMWLRNVVEGRGTILHLFPGRTMKHVVDMAAC